MTLTRFPVSLAVTVTALAALLMAAGSDDFKTDMLLPVAGIFLLASGASAVNQYQEWTYDEKMERTRRRPVPSRRISPADATRMAMISLAGGLILLYYYAPPVCLVLGILNLVWYNGVYTYLKRITAFAVVPGALTGAIPVFMGWTAGGGELSDPRPLFLAFFIFLWQMPHFWMLTLKYGEEYRRAGFPVLTDHLSEHQLKTVIMAWMTASSAASWFLVHFSIIASPEIGYGLVAFNLALLPLFAWQLFFAREIRYRLIFMAGNLFMLIVMVALVASRLAGE